MVPLGTPRVWKFSFAATKARTAAFGNRLRHFALSP
jgi:hypothetical protein